jgi:hypothetical protein
MGSGVGSGVLAAQKLVDADALCGKGLTQHRNALIRVGRAAHEDVKRRVAELRPSMDGDVALGQHRHAGHAARLEMMQVNVQSRRAAWRRADRRSNARRRSGRRCEWRNDRDDRPQASAPESPLSVSSSCLPFGRYLGFPSPSPIARGRVGSCRPPQPEIRTRDAGKPAPRKRKPPDQSTRTDQQRLNPHINANSGESRRFCKKTFNASSRSRLLHASG